MENNNDGNSRVSYMSMVPGELKEFMNAADHGMNTRWRRQSFIHIIII